MKNVGLNNRHRMISVIVGTTVVCLFSSLGAFAYDQGLHRRGRQYIRERKWERAVQTFRSLLKEHPNSIYADDAQFWVGYSLEQIPGKRRQSFDHYQKVIDNYPNSPWVDDAVIHQIILSKKLYLEGDKSAGRFLLGKTQDADSTIQYQAALALGEFKDVSVLPILEEIATGSDGGLAIRAMEILEGYSDVLETEMGDEAGVSAGRSPEPERKSKRVYDRLLRSGKVWTEEELYMNGLYHVAQNKELEFYLSLENDWDRKEWWRKFWVEKDPTPTTSENEAEDEFKRRVRYSWENFGKEWGRSSFSYPPWDSRGELYIKYGSPDHRDWSRMHGYEEWTYYDYRIVFLVSDSRPNTMGDEILLNTVSRYLMNKHAGFRRSFSLRFPRFYYSFPGWEKAKSIKGLKLRITSAEKTGALMHLVYTYSVPVNNFRFRLDQDAYVGAYRYRWVLFDEDYHEVASEDAVGEFSRVEKEELKKGEIEGTVEFNIPAGSYLLALRIEDIHSNRLGIYRKRFRVRNKGVVDEGEDSEKAGSSGVK